MRRTAIQIRKEILKLLAKKGELSFRQMESKINTSTGTIKRQVEDLEALGFITITEHKSHPKNRKPYHTCRITEKGTEYIKK